MLVIGFALGVATLSLIETEDEDEIRSSADDLVMAGRWAADQAWSSGEPIGLFLRPVDDGLAQTQWQYQWFRYRDRDWLPLDIAQGALAEGLSIAIENAEGDWLDLQKLASAEKPSPALVFYPGGEATPAQVVLEDLSDATLRIVIWVDAAGRIETQAERDARLESTEQNEDQTRWL